MKSPSRHYFPTSRRPTTPWSRPATTRAGTVPSDFEMNASAVRKERCINIFPYLSCALTCYIEKLKMEIGASSHQDEKDTVGGILLADKSFAAGINLLHSDGALRSLIRQKQVPLGKVLMLIETAVNIQ